MLVLNFVLNQLEEVRNGLRGAVLKSEGAALNWREHHLVVNLMSRPVEQVVLIVMVGQLVLNSMEEIEM